MKIAKRQSPIDPEWLTLEQASRRLGVHPTTLRRWVSRGALDAFLTPGGHRRFRAADLDLFQAERRYSCLPVASDQQWVEHAVAHARQGIVQQRWLQGYGEEEREASRQLGRRLLGVVLHYISGQGDGEALLAEARAIGRQHALNGLRRGQSLVDLLQAISYFRTTVGEVAIVHLHVSGAVVAQQEASVNLLRRIEALLNEVQTGVVQCYLDEG
ncbi:MAG: MerR family transcriptional regulator [Chloroflexota bacterium]